MELNNNLIVGNILQTLNDACKDFLSQIRAIGPQVKEEGKENYLHLLGSLENFRFIISQHLTANSLELTDICFSDILNANFSTSIRNKKHKSIAYYVQYGICGEKTRLKDSDEIRDIFTIKNCLPVMNFVPAQLADNAIKYMPTYGQLTVVATITEKRKSFRLTNIGPMLTQEDLNNAIEGRGNRGVYAQENALGMGLGLYEATQIVNMHWWLEPNISVTANYDDGTQETNLKDLLKDTTLNSIPLCNFSVFMQFLKGAESQIDKEELKQWQETNLPEIILHNLLQIRPKLVELTRNIEHNIIMRDNDFSWRPACYKMYAMLDSISDLMSVATIAVFGEQDEIVDRLIGDICPLDLNKIIKNKILNILKYLYPQKDIEVFHTGRLKVLNLPAGTHTLLNGIIKTIISQSPDKAQLTVEYASNKYNEMISFSSNEINFQRLFDINLAEKNNDSLLWHKLDLYDLLASGCGFNLNLTHNSLTLSTQVSL